MFLELTLHQLDAAVRAALVAGLALTPPHDVMVVTCQRYANSTTEVLHLQCGEETPVMRVCVVEPRTNFKLFYFKIITIQFHTLVLETAKLVAFRPSCPVTFATESQDWVLTVCGMGVLSIPSHLCLSAPAAAALMPAADAHTLCTWEHTEL